LFEHPFKAGLGPIIDLRKPTITLDEPDAGEYIRGTTFFIGRAEDDTYLESVWFNLANYPDVTLPGYRIMYHEVDGISYKFHRITNILEPRTNQNWNWQFLIDTTQFPDGDFKIRLLVFDHAKKEAVTGQIVFYVKNDRPQINLSFPSVLVGDKPGDLTSSVLNYGYAGTGAFQRVMDTKSLMVGMISDGEEINRDTGVYEELDEDGNPTGNFPDMFPPQIRFWQVDVSASPDPRGTEDLETGYKKYPLGDIPDEYEVEWAALDVEELSAKTMSFTYRLTDVSGTYFGFQIRAQSKDRKHSESYYPQDFIVSGDPYPENEYILIYVREPLEYPTLDLYQLEDFNYWNAGDTKYDDMDTNSVPPSTPLTDQEKKDENYPYITRPVPNNKGGPFTLRMKANHSGGIYTAEVYWEKESDKSVKGRFIWDSAAPAVPTNYEYTRWGALDPHVAGTRNYIFTYHNDPLKDTIPNNPAYHPDVAGQSTVQRYNGPTQENGRNLDFDELKKDPQYWQTHSTLEDGTYNLYVYATSNSTTRVASPFTLSITIDTVKPLIELYEIFGKAAVGLPDPSNGYEDLELSSAFITKFSSELAQLEADKQVNVVNGVIRPTFTLSDEGMGFRQASADPADSTGKSGYFWNSAAGVLGYEQAYIVVPIAQKSTVDAYILANPNAWPFPNEAGGIPSITGVSLPSKYGAIFNASCLFKTSKIYKGDVTDAVYNDASEPEHLPDGVYMLYAFGRDIAFNVGSGSFPIIIDRTSDFPKFDFSAGSVKVGVKEPDSKYDYPDPGEKSFIILDPDDPSATIVRNKFSSNSGVRVRIRDDDSLDLGTGASAGNILSGITVSFVGSQTVLAGDGKSTTTTAYTDAAHIMNLTDAQIKEAFSYQEVTGGKRKAVFEKTGVISQSVLLDLLKNNANYNGLFTGDKAGYTSLPDGLYKITISIKDFNEDYIKLKTPTDPLGLATAVVETEEFWIAVDTKPPEIKITYRADDPVNFSPVNGDYISSTEQLHLVGTVTDANGPITVTGWTVKEGQNPVTGPTLDTSNPLSMAFDSYDGVWLYKFNFPMCMNGATGTFTFEVTFKDRFGATSSLSQRYQVDDVPPTVTLTKLIETFDRSNEAIFPKVSLGTYTQLDQTAAGVTLNKSRLAVKIVSFSVSPWDNFRVDGIHWWLLPANVGSRNLNTSNPSDTGALDSSGQVLDYFAFPANATGDLPATQQGKVYYGNGTSYPTGTNITGFNSGAYGVVDMVNRKFTIAVDSTKMLPANGEYRLHIIARDSAGNISRLTQDISGNPTSNRMQDVFFLQEEDKPYFDAGISPDIKPDTVPSVIGEAQLNVRGTIYENNGFNGISPDPLWQGSIEVWFKQNETLDGTGYPTDDRAAIGAILDGASPSNDLSSLGYIGPVVMGGVRPQPGGISGRNLSLAFNLKSAFTTAQLGGDGIKSYIIRATDSPVNKLREDGTTASVGTAPSPESFRVSRWEKYSFAYDNEPPVIKVENPPTGKSFGNANFGAEFQLEGWMRDANLKTYSSGPPPVYYFDYYLDNNTFTTLPLEAGWITINPGDIYLAGTTAVRFTIPPADVASKIITNFNDLEEGPHTLTLSVADLSGKEASVMYNFVKDTTPPNINFTNINNENNRSLVPDNWWAMSAPDRFTWLLANNPSTIYYDTGKPVLSGSFTDEVSDIAVAFTVQSDGSNINKWKPPEIPPVLPDGTFRYWIDYQPVQTARTIPPLPPLTQNPPPTLKGDADTQAKTAAVLDGSGRNVRWSIYLTADGTAAGTPLPDGVHTIVIEIADTSLVKNVGYYMIAFRVDSKPPVATIEVEGDIKSVYGRADLQTNPVFTLSGTAYDANLKNLELKIVDKTTGAEVSKTTFANPGTAPAPSQTWTYYPFGSTPPYPMSSTEDNIYLTWNYPVNQNLFRSTVFPGAPITPGRSYDVIVVAEDNAVPANKSEEFRWTFTYDTDAPDFIFTNPTDSVNNADLIPKDFIDVNAVDPITGARTFAAANGINRLTAENLRIQGIVQDDASAVRKLESQIWKWNWDADPDGKWEIIETWKDVLDLSTNTSKMVSWTKNLLGQDVAGSGTGLDLTKPTSTWTPETGVTRPADGISAEGLYRIQLRAKDDSFISSPTNDWTNNDMGNPRISDYLYFYYDRTAPAMTITTINGALDAESFYSTQFIDGKFKIIGTVFDSNRFAGISVDIECTDTVKPTSPYEGHAFISPVLPGTLNSGIVNRSWEVEFTGVSNNSDGRYKLTATVADMTGRTYTLTKTFTLDNTPPGARFTLPAKEVKTRYTGNGDDSESTGFASVIVNGGQLAVITGETWDKSVNNSESGIDQMWFHLGFLEAVGAAAPLAPTKASIKAHEDALIALHGSLTPVQVAALSAKERNDYMNTISEYRATSDTDTRGNAWFKLGGNRKPVGFVINNPNIYDWRMEIPAVQGTIPPIDQDDYTASGITAGVTQIGGLKLYGNDITIKGRAYRIVKGVTPDNYRLQMARSVAPAQAGGQAGVYRLPLWVRLVDKVGNVEYYCHDIFFYPDGDIPTTSIENPSNRSSANARGGSISVDGVARSNTSVYDVIFRVFADGVRDSNLDGIKANGDPGDPKYIGSKQPDANMIVRMDAYGYEFVPVETNPAAAVTYNKIPTEYRTTNTGATQGANSGWYRANLMLKGGSGEPLIPWSVTLNASQEITGLILGRGFPSSGSGVADTIRVWLEVFVFNGEGAPIRSSIYQDDGLNTGGQNATGGNLAANPLYGVSNNTTPHYHAPAQPGPRPYVKAFYVKSAAPQITNPNVGDWSGNGVTLVWNPENPANIGGGGYRGVGTEIRRGRFALRAILDPNSAGSDLGQVALRTKLDGGAYSTWTELWKLNDPNLNSNGIRITRRTDVPSPARQRYDFEYWLDSAITANTATYAAISSGAWQFSGGTITTQIRIRDNLSPPNEAEQAIEVKVDNFAPVAHPDERTNPKVAGTNVDFMGRVFDYATAPFADAMNTDYTPRKVDRVYAWFMKNGQYVNINTGIRAAAPASGLRTITAMSGRAATPVPANGDTITGLTLTNRGTSGAVSYPQMAAGEKAHDAAWVREISGATAIPGTKMLWSPVNSADYDIRWSFTVDTTMLPDGNITLCYLAVDASGNASYYTQIISVRNKYPQIERVTLFTDNNGTGAQYTTHTGNDIVSTDFIVNDYRTTMFANYTDPGDHTPWNPAPASTSGKLETIGYLNSGFISKNKYIGFKVETLYGNDALNFRLQHVKRERIPLTKTNLTQMVADRNSLDREKINLYTIAWHGDYSSGKWRALGVPVDNPTLGTHFVLQMDAVPADYVDSSAEVWRYTQVATAIRPDVNNIAIPASGIVEFGPEVTTWPATDRFGFLKTATNDGTFAGIAEYDGSHPDADEITKNNPKDTAFFLIRVWDTVGQSTDPEYLGSNERWVNDQLYDALVVGMNVYLTDKINPTARLYDLNPYTETAVVGNNITDADKAATIRNAANPRAVGNNIVRGGLFNTNITRDLVKSGYVEPRDGSFALTPRNSNGANVAYDLLVSTDAVGTGAVNRDKVSGKVILRGIAHDDQLIDEIWVVIGTGAGTAKNILKLNTTPNQETTGKMVAVAPHQAYAAETLHWKTGHTVEWAYVWDTEVDPAAGRTGGGGPVNNVPVQVYVKDKNGGTANPPTGLFSNAGGYTLVAADNNSTVFHNQVNVDIVPYITGFEREKPKFSTKRSLQGWYSFYQGEQNVALVGYNLGQTAANVAVNLGTSATPAPGGNIPTVWNAANNTAVPENVRGRFSFTIPGTAASGKLDVTVAATQAHNHTSIHATRSWNRESNAYTPGSDLWINKPYAHIWRTTDQDTNPCTYIGTHGTGTNDTSRGLEHPGMALEYTTGAPGRLHGTWSVYGTAIPYYGTNNNTVNNIVTQTTEPYKSPDISIFEGGPATAANIGYAYEGDGAATLYVKAVVTSQAGGSNIANTNGGPTQRFQNIRISKSLANSANSEQNVGRIYMTAFDSPNKGLWYGIRNNNANNTIFIDGGNATGGVGGLAAVQNAGQYSAVDYDNIGPIIAYYDQTNDTVRVALGNNLAATGAGNFTRYNLLPAAHLLSKGSGKFISIKVDKGNGIHLSFYNSVYNKVVYYYAASRANISGGTAPNGTTVKAFTIDSVPTASGNWTDISVDNNGNPWIVYGDNSRTGNYDGVRIAYHSSADTGIQFTGPLTCPVTGSDISGWEALTMPANYLVNNDRLNIEVWPPTVRGGTLGTRPAGAESWNAAIGYASDMYRVGYFYYPGWKGY
jgi:hypothetical protein